MEEVMDLMRRNGREDPPIRPVEKIEGCVTVQADDRTGYPEFAISIPRFLDGIDEWYRRSGDHLVDREIIEELKTKARDLLTEALLANAGYTTALAQLAIALEKEGARLENLRQKSREGIATSSVNITRCKAEIEDLTKEYKNILEAANLPVLPNISLVNLVAIYLLGKEGKQSEEIQNLLVPPKLKPVSPRPLPEDPGKVISHVLAIMSLGGLAGLFLASRLGQIPAGTPFWDLRFLIGVVLGIFFYMGISTGLKSEIRNQVYGRSAPERCRKREIGTGMLGFFFLAAMQAVGICDFAAKRRLINPGVIPGVVDTILWGLIGIALLGGFYLFESKLHRETAYLELNNAVLDRDKEFLIEEIRQSEDKARVIRYIGRDPQLRRAHELEETINRLRDQIEEEEESLRDCQEQLDALEGGPLPDPTLLEEVEGRRHQLAERIEKIASILRGEGVEMQIPDELQPSLQFLLLDMNP